ncbi:universal stress protein [Rhodanobacter sp. B2A1Ga4]|uniref:universal stress protein n=1 Tax=Rhodanobacter sp. B2A1Ga4 TaxID=2778647 RepID=UPI001B394B19|nr:universal stress protein [Rhodanobacter sp. B2A1Ga4]MBQ4856261.1 universal stress protein [Rhodanobacter sp. B2A1Ga4]
MTSTEQTPRVTRPGDILALATSTDPWSPAVIAGVAIASRWGSNLTGCYIDPALRKLIDTEAGAEPTVLGLLLEPQSGFADNHAAFESLARQSGVRNADWIVARTGIAHSLRWLGARHDLAVIERDMVQASGLLDILGEAILSCRLPCLILPPRWNREIRFERIVIGCNGSLEAIRAIHSALPFLKVAQQVTLVDGDVRDGDEQRPRFDPFVYLLRHGITARPSYIRSSSAMAGEILLKEVESIDADLLVMGAYGRSRMRERVFGGATRHVLEEATVPVLMQH